MQRWQTTIGLVALAFVGARITPWTAPPPAPEAPKQAAAISPTPAPTALPTPGPHCPTEGSWLTFDLPVAPRRLPQRPARCTAPPPGGTDQYIAMDAARRGECTRSLWAIQTGMANSMDHCSLYRVGWLCFPDVAQPLWASAYTDFDELAPNLHYLEGTAAEQRALVGEYPELSRIPAAYLPAADGLEARLEAYAHDQELQRMVRDLFGAPSVADHLTRDLYVEAQVALALACVPPGRRTPAMVDAWARRIYVLASAMHGDAGELVRQHRRLEHEELEHLLGAAVGDRPVDGTYLSIPQAVEEAVEVARGERELPVN